MIHDAEKAGGEKYAEIVSLAYRQVIAAHKLVETDDKDLFCAKDIREESKPEFGNRQCQHQNTLHCGRLLHAESLILQMGD